MGDHKWHPRPNFKAEQVYIIEHVILWYLLCFDVFKDIRRSGLVTSQEPRTLLPTGYYMAGHTSFPFPAPPWLQVCVISTPTLHSVLNSGKLCYQIQVKMKRGWHISLVREKLSELWNDGTSLSALHCFYLVSLSSEEQTEITNL